MKTAHHPQPTLPLTENPNPAIALGYSVVVVWGFLLGIGAGWFFWG